MSKIVNNLIGVMIFFVLFVIDIGENCFFGLGFVDIYWKRVKFVIFMNKWYSNIDKILLEN